MSHVERWQRHIDACLQCRHDPRNLCQIGLSFLSFEGADAEARRECIAISLQLGRPWADYEASFTEGPPIPDGISAARHIANVIRKTIPEANAPSEHSSTADTLSQQKEGKVP